MGEDDQKAVQAVYQALASGDRAALRLLLHPYLHWTGADEVTIRGRNTVLALIDNGGTPPAPPGSVELRDGQIYRWRNG